jgi:hypothetical protein
MAMTVPIDCALALKAASLSSKGMNGKEIGLKLKVATSEANILASCGRKMMTIKAHTLTELETELLLTIARAELGSIERASTCSVTTRYVSLKMGKGDGWATRSIRRRLTTHRAGESQNSHGTGLGLAWHSGNGYCGLTSAGWALVHALLALAATK